MNWIYHNIKSLSSYHTSHTSYSTFVVMMMMYISRCRIFYHHLCMMIKIIMKMIPKYYLMNDQIDDNGIYDFSFSMMVMRTDDDKNNCR